VLKDQTRKTIGPAFIYAPVSLMPSKNRKTTWELSVKVSMFLMEGPNRNYKAITVTRNIETRMMDTGNI
jgi:hypothetical protein